MNAFDNSRLINHLNWSQCRYSLKRHGSLQRHTATQSYTKRTISNLSPYTKVDLSHLIKCCLCYHRCTFKQHFLLIFGQKLNFIMVLAYHFVRGIKPAISMQKRWSSLALFGSCLCTSFVKFNEFFWLKSTNIYCNFTFK